MFRKLYIWHLQRRYDRALTRYASAHTFHDLRAMQAARERLERKNAAPA